MTKKTLHRTTGEHYESACGLSLQREHGQTPNGNSLSGRWVLRNHGAFVDFDQYRNDLAERHNFEVGEQAG